MENDITLESFREFLLREMFKAFKEGYYNGKNYETMDIKFNKKEDIYDKTSIELDVIYDIVSDIIFINCEILTICNKIKLVEEFGYNKLLITVKDISFNSLDKMLLIMCLHIYKGFKFRNVHRIDYFELTDYIISTAF